MADSPIDLSAFQGLLSSIQPYLQAMGPTDQDREDAKNKALITGGLGLLGARKGPLGWQQAGQSGINALGAQDKYLSDLQTQKQRAMLLTGEMTKLGDWARVQQANQQFAQQFGNGGPGAQAAAPPAPPVPDASVPNGMASILSAGGNPQLSGMFQPQPQQPGADVPGQPPGVPTKRQIAEQYQKFGDFYMQKGVPDQAQRYYDLAQKMMPQIKEQKTLTTPDGKRVTVNVYTDGSTEVLPNLSPDLEKAHIADTGSAIVPLDPYTGKPLAGSTPVPKTATPGEKMSNALGYANLAESKRYHNMELGIGEDGQPTNVDLVAKAIASYQQPPLSSFAMAKPIGSAIMSKVMEINPTYDAKNYGTAQQSANAFAKGPQSNQVRAFNVGLQHLDTLSQAADALNNGDIQAVNRIGNFISTQTGGPAPTNFNAIKEVVGNEIVKAIVGSGGGVSDRDKAQQTIAAANSPAQLKAVIDSYKTLMAGQLGGLRQQYEAGTQRQDFDKFLSAEAKALLAAKRSGGSTPQVVNFADLPGGR